MIESIVSGFLSYYFFSIWVTIIVGIGSILLYDYLTEQIGLGDLTVDGAIEQFLENLKGEDKHKNRVNNGNRIAGTQCKKCKKFNGRHKLTCSKNAKENL